MNKELKELRKKAREKAQKEFKKEYLEEWKNKEKNSLIYPLMFKINLKTKKKIISLCNKNKISISKYIRGLVLKDLKINFDEVGKR